MDVRTAISTRRARRILDDSRPVGDVEIDALVEAVRLAPSCFNNQPWRMIFVRSREMLEKTKDALAKGNEWATRATLIVVVAAKQDEDCVLGDREYFLFDSGLGIGQLVLRATELGMIAHPIAGFSPKKAREALGIPEDHIVITFVICGYPGTDDSLLSENQKDAEKERPERKPIGENFFIDRWSAPLA